MEKEPRSHHDILQEMVDRWGERAPDKEGQKREIAFRHGYLRGWAYAIDVVFDLLRTGMPIEEVYRLVARFENEKVLPWSADLETGGTPSFDQGEFPTTATGEQRRADLFDEEWLRIVKSQYEKSQEWREKLK